MSADMWLANLPTLLTMLGALTLLGITARDGRHRRGPEAPSHADDPDAGDRGENVPPGP